jgi:RsiW-degrading membrane proteinase PrsW (M82 family)
MGQLLVVLGGICYLAAFVAGIIILIEAFKDEVWKGLVSLLCSLYLLYYALVELDHEHKWVLVATAFLGGIVGGGLMGAGMAMIQPR